MRTAIIKLSGKAIDDFISNPEWIKIITELRKSFDGIILVHGAGTQITDWSVALGCSVNFIEGQRVTDQSVINIVSAVQSGLINGKIVSFLCAKGFDAIGLTGIDNNLFIADYVDEKLGFVGNPKKNKNIKWLKSMIKSSFIPVFSSICRDEEGNLMNVNADLFTNALASAINASIVFFISDVSGVFLNGEPIKQLCEQEIIQGITDKEITGGMIPKLNSCISLLHSGVREVWIGNNLSNLFNFNNNQQGTWIVAAK